MEFSAGERLALVGENGAGKSSLMNVLYGLYKPDRGEIRFGGEPVRLRGPANAIARGVGMVHQHFMLVPTLTVAENVVLGCEPSRGGRLDLNAACAQVEQICRRFGFKLDPRARVDTLSVGSQQKVEIVKALHRGAKVLILDEPTAVLTPQESDELFAVTRELSQAGHAIVFITHKLKEVLSVATRIAVMRRGKMVAQVKPDATSLEELASLMVGAQAPRAASVPAQSAQGAPLLELSNLHALAESGRPALRGLSLQVSPGEIVGIAGVDGNGQSELAKVMTGLSPWQSGQVRLFGQTLKRLTPAIARQLGVAHVPEDRLRRAVIAPMTVEENLSLGRQAQPPFAKGPLIDFEARSARADELIASYEIRPPSHGALLRELSGGNQQKVVVARELDSKPKLLVVAQPTRGLDVAAVAQVHARLLEERNRGAGVLLISLDLEELFALSDRLCVLFEGAVRSTLVRGEFDERRVGSSMLGAEAKSA